MRPFRNGHFNTAHFFGHLQVRLAEQKHEELIDCLGRKVDVNRSSWMFQLPEATCWTSWTLSLKNPSVPFGSDVTWRRFVWIVSLL